VRRDGFALKYASEELKGDREVVLTAVKQDWFAFRYVSEALKFEIVECWANSIVKETKND
jgi:hypothetical protein